MVLHWDHGAEWWVNRDKILSQDGGLRFASFQNNITYQVPCDGVTSRNKRFKTPNTWSEIRNSIPKSQGHLRNPETSREQDKGKKSRVAPAE